ncbi:EAL domain-containing protein [Candidatus Falkowbacteria bacterium]|nr:EAL domain-containing protein [Candidatus Falkowbacteria bacterium]
MSADQKPALHVQETQLEYFELAYNTISQPILLLDENKCVLFANKEFERQTNISNEVARGKSIASIAPEGQHHATQALVASLDINMSGKRSYSTMWLKGEHEELHLAWTISVVALHSMRYFLCVAQEISVSGDERQLNDRITGLPKKVIFDRALTRIMQRMDRDKSFRCAVLMFDLDDFKKVTHLHSLDIAHDVLRRVGKVISENVRKGDVVARFDSDKFGVILDGIKEQSDAVHIAQELRYYLEQPQEYDGRRFVVTASIGLYIPAPSEKVDVIKAHCDEAMHKAKSGGKNRVVVYKKEFTKTSRRHLDLESLLIKGLDSPHDNFFFNYMPIVDVDKKRIHKFEALLRIRDPQQPNHFILPPDLIKVAEDTGYINQLGRWAILSATMQIAQWSKQYPLERIGVSVNVSLVQVFRGTAYEAIKDAIEQTGIDPQLLSVELTESMFAHDIARIQQLIGKLKDIGVSSSLDDFGAGQTQIRQLSSLPIDEIKIDKSFLTRPFTSHDRGQLGHVIALAKHAQKTVVCEGIETKTHYQTVVRSGGDFGQGFAFSAGVEPMIASAFIRKQASGDFNIFDLTG